MKNNYTEKEPATGSPSNLSTRDLISNKTIQQIGSAVNQSNNNTQLAQPTQSSQTKTRAKSKPVLINDVVKVLNTMHIAVKYNVISGRMEITGMPKVHSAENAENVLPILICDHFRSNGKNVSVQTITDALIVIADRNRYNPVVDMLNSVKYDGYDYLSVIDKILGICDNAQGRKLLRKWMHQTIALALNDECDPYGADGVLVLQGDQGAGKTQFFRILSVFSKLFAEGVSIDTDSKDSIMQATSVWIAELGELDSTLKREQSSLKAFITAAQDTYRAPYARAATRRARRTSLCGTVNPDLFLYDETGSRRYWIIHVDHIDLTTLMGLTSEWLIHMWQQVYVQYYLPNPQGFRLSPEERSELLASNKGYEKPMPGELDIVDRLDLDRPESEWKYYTTSDVMQFLNIRGVSSSQIGKVLTKLAKNDPRITVKTSHNVKTYRLPPLPDYS